MKNDHLCESSHLETYVVERQSLAAPPKS